MNTLTNPRFQGSMQALGGLMEAGIGGSAALGSGGLLGSLGLRMMAHGMDQYISGMNTAFSGRSMPSVTTQLLQKTGMSSQSAALTSDFISIFRYF
ncbi:MAG: hypothetical protein WCP39_05470 [Chlamydiota bacterium]